MCLVTSSPVCCMVTCGAATSREWRGSQPYLTQQLTTVRVLGETCQSLRCTLCWSRVHALATLIGRTLNPLSDVGSVIEEKLVYSWITESDWQAGRLSLICQAASSQLINPFDWSTTGPVSQLTGSQQARLLLYWGMLLSCAVSCPAMRRCAVLCYVAGHHEAEFGMSWCAGEYGMRQWPASGCCMCMLVQHGTLCALRTGFAVPASQLHIAA